MKGFAAAPGLFGALLLLLPATPAASDPGFPKGWSGGSLRMQDYEFGTAAVDGATGNAAYIRAKPDAVENVFFTMTQCVPAGDYAGKRMRLSARMKTVAAGGGQLWMRVDRGRLVVGFDNMSNHVLTGTKDWQPEVIVLDVPGGSTRICFGFMLAGGRGGVWADDLKLEPVGMNVLPTTPYKGPTVGSGGFSVSHGGMGRFDGR